MNKNERVGSTSERLAALDALRGIAALVVVIHHALLATELSGVWDNPAGVHTPLEWLLVRTPVSVIWDGPAAVLIFFVLSGLVLALPYRSKPFQAAPYYASRLIRLYLPVAVSLSWASLTVLVVGRQPGLTWWLDRHTSPLTLAGVLRDAVLLVDVSFLNSPLWSLRWEVYFSLAFPIFLLLLRARGWKGVAAFLALMIIGFVGRYRGVDALNYMSVFGLGVVLAANIDHLKRWRAHPTGVLAALVAGVTVLSLPWWPVTVPLAQTWRLLGACVIVAAVVATPQDGWLARSHGARWLGQVSFSLYLVHEPLVVTLANLGIRHPLVLLAVTVPTSLALAGLFYRFVESPTHQLARSAGARLRRH